MVNPSGNNENEIGNRNGEPFTKRAKLQDGPTSSYTMAYLGPPGTYGQMAAAAFKSCYDTNIELIPCPSISAIWETSATFHVLPLENTIHGGVTETLDCLLSSLHGDDTELGDTQRRRRIIADLALPISHVLVVRKGVKKEDIRWIRSHEQALGQSSKFIKAQYPTAKLKTYPSTAGAAISLLNPTEADLEEGEGAALCSKAAAKLYEDQLDILYEGTQGISNNFTRFILLSNSSTSESQTPLPTKQCASPSPTAFYILPSAKEIIPFFQHSTIRNIHSRPNPILTSKGAQNGDSPREKWVHREERFSTLYFIEVDVSLYETDIDRIQKDKGGEKSWYIGKAEWRVTDQQISAL
ncbi:uncharacterized protein I303_108082 [Kwoniella dejecticola CBS 10117]|uniref:Prephenate dehydratase domain-containing protein n=1 Tax=Kwoniella dejecticola CBS 10117 TaxID=1296121 RepID=A0A1A5ZWH9_9TREE|nr:uncharacterized protein I303_08073 [Kwoniella dejecticola CBS 10117]OBR82159.1 hypothetical protein I303_08073 [Kwoniella dejecticola CBS 10117]